MGLFLGLAYKDIQFQNPEEDYKFFIYSNNMPQMWTQQKSTKTTVHAK